MNTSSKILSDVDLIFKSTFPPRNGFKIPEIKDVTDNETIKIEGAVLYADLRNSTQLVNTYTHIVSIKIYKAFLKSICEVIRNNFGEITAFDGDRVMAVFTGSSKCSNATKAALQIYYIVNEINKKFLPYYIKYTIDYAVGIDVSDLSIIKTGIWHYNDLAWIGSAANIAAKLSEFKDQEDKTFITQRVFERINDESKYGGKPKTCMWHYINKNLYGQDILASNWYWPF